MARAKFIKLGPVADVRDFLSKVLEKRGSPEDLWVFRGQLDATWDPSPQIDRLEFEAYRQRRGWPRARHEGFLLEEFKKGARPHTQLPPQNQWEWLALAQHHGLATRLLDWTSNPLGALYFACEEPVSAADSAVWCYHHAGEVASAAPDPFAIKRITAYWPPHVTQRITVQGGCFTAHPPVTPRLGTTWPGDLRQIIVPSAERRGMRLALTQLGITRSTLFPDLDGIAFATNRRVSADRPMQAPVPKPTRKRTRA